jgi:archaemetzincin
MKSGTAGFFALLTILGCSNNEMQHRIDEREVASKRQKICVLAISKFDSTVLQKFTADLEKIFEQEVEVSQSPMDLGFAYNPERRQYHSSVILGKLSQINPEGCERTLGIVDVDLYVPDLNFVFGEADVVTRMAVIATKRLRPEYYALAQDERLFLERTLKESVHELGHTYGLGHCPDKKCVMHFSNSLADTDLKSCSFCDNCRRSLMSTKRLRGQGSDR